MQINQVTQSQNNSNNSLNFKRYTGVVCENFNSTKIVNLIEQKIDSAMHNPYICNKFRDYDIGITLKTVHKDYHPVYYNYYKSTCTISRKPAKGINRLWNLFCAICPSKKTVLEHEGGFAQDLTEEGLVHAIDLYENKVLEKARNYRKL